MQRDDGIIGEEADLPAFLLHSDEDKEKLQVTPPDSHRLPRGIQTPQRADPNPQANLALQGLRCCPPAFWGCLQQKNELFCVLTASCHLQARRRACSA